jgi:hypothetical protein
MEMKEDGFVVVVCWCAGVVASVCDVVNRKMKDKKALNILRNKE